MYQVDLNDQDMEPAVSYSPKRSPSPQARAPARSPSAKRESSPPKTSGEGAAVKETNAGSVSDPPKVVSNYNKKYWDEYIETEKFRPIVERAMTKVYISIYGIRL
jgi:hypothetical protein